RAFADALRDLWGTPSKARSEIGQQCRQRAIDKFPIQKTADEYLQVYRDALAERGAAMSLSEKGSNR
ncbi:MAG: glycosyltransferase, partial [Bradymonadaceae bacterium]